MTDQEKKEKAIEELAQFMGKCSIKCCNICTAKAYNLCTIYNDAKEVYDAGYRKADEVKKETAIKILNGLVDIAEKFLGDDYKGIFAAQVAIEMEEFIKKEFGVEVK